MLEVTVNCVQSVPTVVLNIQTAQLHVEPFCEVLPQGPATQTQWSCWSRSCGFGSLNRPHLPKQTSRSAIRDPCASSQNTCGSWTAICRHPRIHNMTGNRKRNRNQFSVDQQLSMLCFYVIARKSNFWVKGISIEAVFVNQLSGNAGISDLRIVWFKKNCHFMIYIFNPVYLCTLFECPRENIISQYLMNSPLRKKK